MISNYKKHKKATEKLYSFLNLERKIVGVKFLKTEDEYLNEALPENSYLMSYCNMVRTASNGHRLKVKKENFRCMSSARAFGFYEKEEKHSSGSEYYSYGLYKTQDIAKSVQDSVKYLDMKIYGLLIQPLEFYKESDFDVAIIITNPYNTMRIVQAYSYSFGFMNTLGICSNQAVCSELTVRPYLDKNMNISFLCSDSRFSCGWDSGEMGIGISSEIFHDVAEGVIATFNATEPDSIKKDVQKKLENNNLSFEEIKYGQTYFYEKRKD